jgi:3-hydroxybutyryl-CoA dehydrogenase
MSVLNQQTPVAVLGSGTMGTGIAQIAAANGHAVVLYDIDDQALSRARAGLEKILNRQVDKGRMSAAQVADLLACINFTSDMDAVADRGLVIEAIIEDLAIKQKLFTEVCKRIDQHCILATNTSSLSVAAIAAAVSRPERMLGTHFFNPAPLMPLVEIVPGLTTDDGATQQTRALIDAWGKTTVLAKDTPGFIVNRVARPFYGESIRILEEGIADAATIDWAMRELGGFRMGPFQLMDLIGMDINYTVTETVFEAFFYDPRYKPSFTQKRMVEAGRLGRKTGRGFYDYAEGAAKPQPNEDPGLGQKVLDRVLTMLINEAVDAVFWKVASAEDVDLAMTKGVNYPKGLLAWGEERGLDWVLAEMILLRETYCEDRYRPSPLLRRMVNEQRSFFG